MGADDRLAIPGLDGFGAAELFDLEERSAHVLRMRSGIADGERRSLRRVGDELGVSRERVRQIQEQGLLLIAQVRGHQRRLRGEPTLRTYRFARRGAEAAAMRFVAEVQLEFDCLDEKGGFDTLHLLLDATEKTVVKVAQKAGTAGNYTCRVTDFHTTDAEPGV